MNEEVLKIGKICNITTGKLDSNQFIAGGQYPFFTCAPEPLHIDSFAFDDSVILIAGNNASGNFHLNRFDGKFNAYQRTYVLTEKPNFDLDYIFYALKLELKRLKEKSQGSQTKFLTMPILNDISIPKKDYALQQKIASVLSSLDSKIELNNKINSELEEIAKILYNYWFVQFDFPNKNGKPYKTSGGKLIYNDELKREIPEGWEVGNLASSKISKILDTGINEFKGNKIYLSTSEVENSEIINHGILEEYANRTSRANMQPVKNSIWFARMKDTKKVLVISEFSNEIIDNYIFSTGFAGISSPKESFYYLWNFIDNPYFEAMKDTNSTGSTQKSIINESIANIKLLIPGNKILSKFNEVVYPSYKQIYLNQRENKELSELRDWLLPMLMNGQVKVK